MGVVGSGNMVCLAAIVIILVGFLAGVDCCVVKIKDGLIILPWVLLEVVDVDMLSRVLRNYSNSVFGS